MRKPRHIRSCFLTAALVFLSAFACLAQSDSTKKIPAKTIPAKRTTAVIKIDGNLDEAAWKEAPKATGFIEYRPATGKPENEGNRTEVYLLYDNTSVYVGGYCFERSKDSISKELIGRDKIGVNDYVGVILDTYHDKINGSGFYVTPYGEQFDAKYSSGDNGEDDSWNAVWDSEAKLHADGWSFEMRIPYSALRFNSANTTWGINIIRRRNKSGQQLFWNPVSPTVNGFVNQEGAWTGIEKIEAPLRLSLSPYFSTYVNHYPYNTAGAKNTQVSVNGGMDVKYGINESFTLDMTLVPDFGQVRSDNQVLNLSPFEVKFDENRPFFTEGAELFKKGNLFYSRRIGSRPLHFGDAQNALKPNEHITSNPLETRLLNATKISGRTKGKLGIGFFNAVTKPMYAEIEDDQKSGRRYQTAPLTNYNIVVLDQTLKNNSSVSFINTNVLRSGSDYDANVSAALFDLNNKKNTFNWNGKVAVSQLSNVQEKTTKGYSHNLGFGKTGGRWNFQIGQEVADRNYDINDMGILFNNNYIDHYFWTGYRWLKPKGWYNRIQVNFNAYYSNLFSMVPGQKVVGKYQQFRTNINANAQLKNLWFIGGFVGFLPAGNDFYEPPVQGRSFRATQRFQYSGWFETNNAKKYSGGAQVFAGLRKQFSSPYTELNLTHRYRFNDKFALSQDIYYSPTNDDAGFYDLYYQNNVLQDVIFSRRDRRTIENVVSAKYNFNNRSGITFRARHYWSKVEPQQLFDLMDNGTLVPTKHTDLKIENQNYNTFTIDAVYTVQFAPGSFINIVWKNRIETFDKLPVQYRYFKNFSQTVEAPQNNNFSIKVLYYLDYLDLKKWRSKKKGL